jgi:hypothetical protein
MADRKPPRTPLVLSPEALFRYQIVSAVRARALSGQGIDAAVRAVAAQTHPTPAGESTTVSVRSIYRWLAEDDRDEPAVLEPAAPVIARALPTALLDFLAAEKAEDCLEGAGPNQQGLSLDVHGNVAPETSSVAHWRVNK